MSHGNRVHEAPKVVHKEWQGVSNNRQDVAQWIKDCVQHEKDISAKNKIASEQFHNRHRGI